MMWICRACKEIQATVSAPELHLTAQQRCNRSVAKNIIKTSSICKATEVCNRIVHFTCVYKMKLDSVFIGLCRWEKALLLFPSLSLLTSVITIIPGRLSQFMA